jgi:hypothetical protein
MAEVKRTFPVESESVTGSPGDAPWAALERLDLLLAEAARIAEVVYGVGFDEDRFRGLHLDAGEVGRLLDRMPGISPLAAARTRPVPLLDEKDLRFTTLGKRFGLDALALDILLVALAPEIDPRYERLYAYLQDDVTRKRPGVDLILNLLTATAEEKLAGRRHFLPASPLLRHQLLQLHEDPSGSHATLLSRHCKVDERIVEYLLGGDGFVNSPDDSLTLFPAGGQVAEVPLSESRREALPRIVAEARAVLHLRGVPGSGRRTVAAYLARRSGRDLLCFDPSLALPRGEGDFYRDCRRAVREARLRGALLFVVDFDSLLDESQAARLREFSQALEDWDGATILAGELPWRPLSLYRARPFARIEISIPDYGERARLWGREMTGMAAGELDAVAARFNFTPGQIHDAAHSAGQMARSRQGGPARIQAAELFEACRRHSNQKLGALARKIDPRHGWDDIVLPDDALEQLREICRQAVLRPLVLDQWGFERKLSYGKGLNVLFSGPPGTGKTLAAQVIAWDLGLDLYQIDLSRVVSKYIGETEKNLDKIFTEARTSNAILLFDEADALFGKRSEVKDAHDRYANIETGYLLQKMEEYEGIAILATNLRGNLDEAFIRRMSFCVEFPFPREGERRLIWEKIWPSQAPRRADLPLARMADRFEISGGNIKNIALAAAFLAAHDGGEIAVRHLLRATRREYQKMGKILDDGDFRERMDE